MKWQIEDSDHEALKDIYVQYAIASNFAQQIESNLQTLLMAATKAEKGLSYKEYIDLEDIWGRKTLGDLIRCVGNRFGPSPALDPLLDEARKKRNYLVHHFFRVNAEKFVCPIHYPNILSELKTISSLMEEAGSELLIILKRAILLSGTTAEEYEEFLERFLAESSF